MRTYHVVVKVTDKSMVNYGKEIYLTNTPLPHDEACTVLNKLSKCDWRENSLKEAVEDSEFRRQYALALATGPSLMRKLRGQ